MSKPIVNAPAAELPLALYLGSVNAWECDEMGHMNVRFYVQRAMEGAGLFAAALGMPKAFSAKSAGTLQPVTQHIRFLKEARPGAPLSMRGGVLGSDETTIDTFMEMRHGDGAPAAAITTRFAHVDAHTERAFPWKRDTLVRAEAYACVAPAHGLPRSIDATRAGGEASASIADALAMPVVGRGMVRMEELDVHGRFRPEMHIARVSDSVPNLLSAWRAEAAQAVSNDEGEVRVPGAAVLEYRLIYRHWPQAGDLLEMRSALAEVTEKTHRLVHWILDPVSGKAWATAEAVAVTFDLKTRKTIVAPPAHRARLQAQIIAGLTI
jgi:acyl-CoA thioester hydrolase